MITVENDPFCLCHSNERASRLNAGAQKHGLFVDLNGLFCFPQNTPNQQITPTAHC